MYPKYGRKVSCRFIRDFVSLFVCFNNNPRINCCNLYVTELWYMYFQIFHVTFMLP